MFDVKTSNVIFYLITNRVCNSTGKVTTTNATNSYCCTCDGCNQGSLANRDNCVEDVPDQRSEVKNSYGYSMVSVQ